MNTITEDVNVQATPQTQTAPPKKQKNKRFKEGRKLKSLPPMTVIVPFIMKKRNDALNYFEDSLDIGHAEAYIAKKRAEGYTGFGLMHVFLAAYVRTLAEKPGVNRFIRGQRIYARNNIEICLTIKKEMRADSPDTVVKFFPEPTATPIDIYNEVSETINSSKAENDNSLDGLMGFFCHVPAFMFRFIVGLFMFLDYYRLLPRAFTKISPFHGSYFITSMGSLGIPPIYHHIYNFGNIPLFTSFGSKYKEHFVRADGTVGTRKKVDYKIVMDERICDGFYYASALKTMQFYLAHPERMDVPPSSVLADVT